MDSPDAALAAILHAMSQFFANQRGIVAGYTLQGEALESYTSLAFLIPIQGLMMVNAPVNCGRPSTHSKHGFPVAVQGKGKDNPHSRQMGCVGLRVIPVLFSHYPRGLW